ncbi:MAG: glycosyltransferase family 9 protein [Alphaproteobacteria bacterium]
MILAMGPFAAIRAHHPGDEIVLLTTAPYAALAEASPYFDAVWVDARPPWYDLAGVLRLRRRLRAGGFSRVYDLQTSARSSAYYRLFAAPRPEWSGVARGCSHPHGNPRRDFMHTIERQREQLRDAGIGNVPAPDLGWLDGDLSGFALPARYVLMVPGGAAHRPAKRWPADGYAALGRWLHEKGVGVVLIGAGADRAPIGDIARRLPDAVDLSGRTSFGQVAALARRAAGAVGNDTGPMHLIAVLGCPSVVLFSAESDPALCAPRGAAVKVIRAADLASLSPEAVRSALELR